MGSFRRETNMDHNSPTKRRRPRLQFIRNTVDVFGYRNTPHGETDNHCGILTRDSQNKNVRIGAIRSSQFVVVMPLAMGGRVDGKLVWRVNWQAWCDSFQSVCGCSGCRLQYCIMPCSKQLCNEKAPQSVWLLVPNE